MNDNRKIETIEFHVKKILELIGEDPRRTGLVNTPHRVAKMYSEIFRGYCEDEKPKVTAFPNNDDGLKFTGMIIDQGYFFSHCEHHMVPFFGYYHFGYIPNEMLIGASKIGRLVDYYSARLQIAERLCKNVLDEIETHTKPKGSILVMSARHLCKEMRGLKKHNSPFDVDDARGCFEENDGGCKDEFMMRIRR